MPGNTYRRLFIHSTLIFVSVFILSTIIHEGMHAITGKLYGLQVVLHHNYVSTNGEDSSGFMAKIMTPGSGPLISLLQGIIFLLIARMQRKKSLLSLFYLWMSVFGFITAFGYVAMTPLFAYGDTGKVATLLGFPQWLNWIIGVGGVVAFVVILRGMSGDFIGQIPSDFSDDKKMRRKAMTSLIAFPVLAGVVLCTILSLPVPTFLSLLYPVTSPFANFMIYGKIMRTKENITGTAAYPENFSLTLIIFTILMVVITRLLVPGVAL